VSIGLAGAASERRLVLVVGAVVFLDTLFYAVIAPLLPSLSHELHLSKLSAGILTASYAIGTLVAAVPGGLLAGRAGPRFALCTGLALLACSTIAFGFLQSAPLLDLARFVEGAGGACSWAGGLAWLIAETPPERRGATIGGAMAIAIGGSLFGPAIGALATATGRPPLFTTLAVIAVVLIVVTRRLPDHGERTEVSLSLLARVMRRRAVAVGMWLMTLPAIVSGTLNVLAPLRLHRFGAGAGVIGATFLVAAAIEGTISPLIGTLSDRRGRRVPLIGGLAAMAVLLLCFTLPGSAAPLVVVVIIAASAMGVFWAPTMAMLSDAAEQNGLDQGLAAALMNLAWAGGQVLGSAGSGAIAKATGDLVPTWTLAGICALTLCSLTIRRRSIVGEPA
jgi:MFS family permease